MTPEGEIGPYFADDSAAGFNRSNILANLDGSNVQAGVPLTLSLSVRDSQRSCAAVAASQVDIWHCNASGVYSANTTQLFFPQSLVDALSAGVAPYSTHGTNSTTNAGDHVYTPETKGVTLLALTGSVASGYAATFNVDLPIASG